EELPDFGAAKVVVGEDGRRLSGLRAEHAPFAIEDEDRLAHVIEELAQALVRVGEALFTVENGRIHRLESACQAADFVAMGKADLDAALAAFEPPNGREERVDG